jgi:proteasome lid subunit RPN8/RPN11
VGALRITASARAELERLAGEFYPVEGCGVLVGEFGADLVVVRAIRGRNLVTDRARDRYELDPGDIVAAERAARAAGLDVVGFWHTHPDHPARPSRFDTERAWPEYAYVICATTADGVADLRAWTLREAGGEFEELPIAAEGAA